jgi:DNA-binding transcriptional MerR regulator
MTIDALAQRSGTPSSTIRLYQAKGLLPGPEKEGRVGYYGREHLARLRLIAELQEKGFSLASIGGLVDAWEAGQGLNDVLGLEAQVAVTWGEEEALLLRPEELAARFPGGALPADVIERTLRMGLISIEGDRVVVKNPRMLEVGSELAELGVPLGPIIDDLEALQEVLDQVAVRFTRLFEEHLWAPFVEAGLPGGDLPELTTNLQHLSRLAESVVANVLRQALKKAASEFLAEQAGVLNEAGLTEQLRPLAIAAGLDAP